MRRGWFMDDVAPYLVLALIAVGIFIGAAHFEAASYRKITERTDVTTWDALWLNLRVCDR